MRHLYLKRRGREDTKAHTVTASTEAQSPIASPSLPIRSPPTIKSIASSRNDPRTNATKPHESLQYSSTNAADAAELALSLPEVSEQRPNSPKRKRSIFDFDEDELPSSSPLGLPMQGSAWSKRQRRESLRTKLLEIASTPDNSPRRPELIAALQPVTTDDDLISISNGEEPESEGPEMDGSEVQGDFSFLGRPASPTLSSPSRTVPNTQQSLRPDTQAIFQHPTPLIDLDIPSPEEGWDDEDELQFMEPDPNSQLIDSPLENVILETQPELPDTQLLLNSKTQIPDFALAEPDGGWDTLDLLPSSPPAVPEERSSPAPNARAHSPTPPPELLTTSINRFLEDHMLAGYEADDCLASLKATSLDLELAELVLRHMTKKGKGRLPRNEEGVWTKEDDEDLEASDARRVERVYEKHGQESVERRWEFWKAWRELGAT